MNPASYLCVVTLVKQGLSLAKAQEKHDVLCPFPLVYVCVFWQKVKVKPPL